MGLVPEYDVCQLESKALSPILMKCLALVERSDWFGTLYHLGSVRFFIFCKILILLYNILLTLLNALTWSKVTEQKRHTQTKGKLNIIIL